MRKLYLVAAIVANFLIFLMCVYARYGWQNIWPPSSGGWSVYSFGAYGLGLSYATATFILIGSIMLGAKDVQFTIWMVSFSSATAIFSFLTYVVATALRGP